MSEPKVLFEDHGNIAVIKLNRPEKRNALDPETVMMFNEFSEKAKDPKFKAVIVTGDESAFCGGADITAAASEDGMGWDCLLYTSPSPRDLDLSRMPSSA